MSRFRTQPTHPFHRSKSIHIGAGFYQQETVYEFGDRLTNRKKFNLYLYHITRNNEDTSLYDSCNYLAKYSTSKHNPISCGTICLGHPSIYRKGEMLAATDPEESMLKFRIPEDFSYTLHEKGGPHFMKVKKGTLEIDWGDHLLYCMTMDSSCERNAHEEYFKGRYGYTSSAFTPVEHAESIALEIAKSLLVYTLNNPSKVYDSQKQVQEYLADPDILNVAVSYGPVIYRRNRTEWVRNVLIPSIFDNLGELATKIPNLPFLLMVDCLNFIKPAELSMEHEYRFCIGLRSSRPRLLKRGRVITPVQSGFNLLFQPKEKSVI